MEIIILSLLLLTLAYVVILLDIRRGWKRISPFFIVEGKAVSTRVSVIIAARNEEEHIGKTLDALLSQHYPNQLLEVIVINDHSDDRTAEIVSSYGEAVKLINFLDPTKINSYKKAAIAQAIEEAKGDVIITTDADCLMDKEWLLTMVQFYEANRYKMISGPVCYHEEAIFFEKLQSTEFLFLIGMGASTIGNRRPTTCNGANLLYEKSVFFEVGGFDGIDKKASGDDELLLHKISALYPDKIGFLKSQKAFVKTYAKPSLLDFISQRKRWASKGTSYRDPKIILMGILLWLFNVSLLAGIVYSVFNFDYFPFFILILMIKCICDYSVITPMLQFAEKLQFRKFIPVLSLVHVLYLVYIGIAGNTGSYNWKGRKVK